MQHFACVTERVPRRPRATDLAEVLRSNANSADEKNDLIDTCADSSMSVLRVMQKVRAHSSRHRSPLRNLGARLAGQGRP